jgi:type IV fimbrial biogenesis protein FimT
MHGANRQVRKAICGFTAIELLVGVAVAGLLAAFALPSYSDWITWLRVTQEAEHLANSMNVARAEAIKRGFRVNVCKSSDGRQCTPGSPWDAGWIIHADTNGDGQIDSIQALVQGREQVAPGVSISANRPLADYVSYTSYGHARMLNGALQIGTLTVCARGQKAVDVVLSAGGRARIAKTARPCP